MEVLVTSPWVPMEWIRAHGLESRGAWFVRADPSDAVPEGVCAFARAMSRLHQAYPQAGMVFTTACDQMRRAADAAATNSGRRSFLFLLPATWQTPAARKLYHAEVVRLGRYLEGLGGRAPSDEQLVAEIHRFEAERAHLRKTLETGSVQEGLAALAALHEPAFPVGRDSVEPLPSKPLLGSTESHPTEFRVAGHGPQARETLQESRPTGFMARLRSPRGVPLALVGGPLLPSHWFLFDAVEAVGGRVVLNATEPGERSVLPPMPPIPAGQDPLAVLADHYFDHAVDVFHRPNTRLYAWLGERLKTRGARGILLWAHVGCDLWRVEAASIREAFELPLLVIEAHETETSDLRTRQRLCAFVESLP